MNPALPPAFIRVMDTLWLAFSGLRIFFIVLDILLFGVFIYALTRSFEVLPKFHGDWRPKKKIITLRQVVFREKWNAIMKKFHGASPDAMRVTIIEADALIDEVLKQMGLQGEHLADRLKQLDPRDMPTIQRVWKAHRLRNDIVHRAGFSFAPEDAQGALEDFEAFMKEVGAL